MSTEQPPQPSQPVPDDAPELPTTPPHPDSAIHPAPAPQNRGASLAPRPAPVGWQPMAVPARPNWFGKGFGLGAGGALGAGLVLLGLWLVGSILAGLVFAGFAAAVKHLGTNSADSGGLTTVWGKDDAKHTLRAIDVTGPIMASGSDGLALTASTYGYEVADTIDGIGKDDAGGLVLRMDTPGGTINGARAIGDAVVRYQQRTGHKVVAVVEGMSASGGMFAMAPADEIIADHGTLVGSIGVISGPFQQYKDVKAVDGGLLAGGVTTTGGVTSEYLSQGRGKDFGNPWRAMTAEERKVWMDGLSVEYGQFVGWVSKYRKIPEATIRNDLGAHIFDPETAKKKHLVDAVMGRDEAYREAARANGLDPADTRIEAATAPGALAQLFGAEARVYGHGLQARSEGNQPPRATSVICSGAPQVLAWSGPTTNICGR